MANLRARGQRHPLAEVRRLRAELAEALKQRDEARAALVAYPLVESSLRQVAAAAYAGGHGDGYRDGYTQAEADQAAAWNVTRRLLHNAVAPTLDPAGWAREQARDAARRIRAAEAAEKRDQAEHERAFVARARATPDHLRSEPQQAALRVYPGRDRGHLRVVGQVARD